MESTPSKENKQKVVVGCSPMCLLGHLEREEQNHVFVGPSGKRGTKSCLKMLKHLIISALIFWAGIMPDMDTSFVKRLSYLCKSTVRS